MPPAGGWGYGTDRWPTASRALAPPSPALFVSNLHFLADTSYFAGCGFPRARLASAPSPWQEWPPMNPIIRPLDPADLAEADRIFRLAFGTFLGLPDPLTFAGDADFVRTRWRTSPETALGAYLDGTLLGSNFVTRWGSFGFFGPLTVRPDLWDRGIAQRLLERTVEIFDRGGTENAALFTFPQSARHLGLYQKFGFWPQSLTPVLAKPVPPEPRAPVWTTYAQLAPEAGVACLDACRALTDAVFPGLDVRSEIEAVVEQRLGDTVLVQDDHQLAALAICHLGAGTEAGSNTAYIKLGAVRPGADAATRFSRLLAACEAFAATRGLRQLVGGVNTACHDAYRHMLECGFRMQMIGVAMQRPHGPGLNRPDRHIIADWR